MPQPTQSQVHIDAALTDVSVAFSQEPGSFVADKVFPRVNVAKQSDKYWVWDRNNFLIDSMEKRADGQESAGGGLELSTDSYFCDVYALHKDIGAQTRANEDPGVRLDEAVTKYLTGQAMLKLERSFVTTFMGSGIWSTTVTGASNYTQWDDASSNPEKNIDDGKQYILQRTGYEPNTLVTDYATYQALKRHPLIKDRTKYTSADSITQKIIANFFEIDNLYVAKSMYASNNEGAATDTYAFNFPKGALLAWVPAQAGLLVPSPGYTFVWNGMAGAVDGQSIGRIDMPLAKSERLEIETNFDQKIVSSELGYYFASTVA